MIYQLVPSLSRGDAVGNEINAIHRYFQEHSIESAIVSDTKRYPSSDSDYSMEAYLDIVTEQDMIIVHMATYWQDLPTLIETPKKRVMVYHNITPESFFVDYDENTAYCCKLARRQVRALSKSFDIAIGDSEYNAQELRDFGYKNVVSIPLLIPFEDYEREPNKKLMETYQDGKTNILFVGRLVPNKCIEDILFSYMEYRKINANSRLILVGSDAFTPYVGKLHLFCRDHLVPDVVFANKVSFSDILAYYRVADLFLCLSEHEGFCVPLLEAMTFQVPIVAYASTAIPKTLGDAGVLLDVMEKDPTKIAAVMNAVLSDNSLKEQLNANAKKRLMDFAPEVIFPQLLSALQLPHDNHIATSANNTNIANAASNEGEKA